MLSGDRAAEVARKLTVLDSLHMQREAWNKINQSTIVNCYRRASFVPPTDAAEDEGQSSDSEVYVPLGMATDDFERYAAVDDNISAEADISESAIVSTVQQSDDQSGDQLSDSNGDDDDDDATTEPVSFSLAKQSQKHSKILGTERL